MFNRPFLSRPGYIDSNGFGFNPWSPWENRNGAAVNFPPQFRGYNPADNYGFQGWQGFRNQKRTAQAKPTPAAKNPSQAQPKPARKRLTPAKRAKLRKLMAEGMSYDEAMDAVHLEVKDTREKQEAAKNLMVAVTHGKHPFELLTAEQLQATEKMIMQRVMDRPDDATPVSFYKCEHRHGWLYFATANETSREWLVEDVPKHVQPDGITLSVMPVKSLPKTHMFTIEVPKDGYSIEEMKKIFQRMNDNLDTSKWECQEKSATEKKQKYTILIDNFAKVTIEKRGYKLFYKFGRITFQIIKKVAAAVEVEETPADEPKADDIAMVDEATKGLKIEPEEPESK